MVVLMGRLGGIFRSTFLHLLIRLYKPSIGRPAASSLFHGCHASDPRLGRGGVWRGGEGVLIHTVC